MKNYNGGRIFLIRRREHHPEFAREKDIERRQYSRDAQLTASLKKSKSWKEYNISGLFSKGNRPVKERNGRGSTSVGSNTAERS